MNKYVEKKYVNAIEQNVLRRRVSGLRGGGGIERNRRRVDMVHRLDFDLGLHRLVASAVAAVPGSTNNKC